MTFNDGAAQSRSIPTPTIDGGAAYFGFTDQGKSITSVTITLTGDAASLDDVTYVPAPEPTALPLLAIAAISFARFRRTSPDANHKSSRASS
jgi:hypothetical protein